MWELHPPSAPLWLPTVFMFFGTFPHEIGLLKFAVKEHSHNNQTIRDEKKKIWGSKIKINPIW
jgi:hypothetical protein